jgi:predicted DNA-binding transcriptional regulator
MDSRYLRDPRQRGRSGSDDDDRGPSPGAAQLGEEEGGLEEVEQRLLLSPLLATLPKREQMIIHLRFYRSMTQSEIAERMYVSKGTVRTHVSALLRKLGIGPRAGLTNGESGELLAEKKRERLIEYIAAHGPLDESPGASRLDLRRIEPPPTVRPASSQVDSLP